MATTENLPPVVSLHQVSKTFGGLLAVNKVSFELQKGTIQGLIGPNGAGKTTVFNLITGVTPVTSGQIEFNGDIIDGLESFEITRLGVARTFQNIRLFSNLTVLDNVRVAFHAHCGYSTADSFFRTKRFYEQDARITEEAKKLLQIFKLADLALETAKNLPYGQQRHLEIARALACQPQLLLLDEPAAGMNPKEILELMDLIHFIKNRFNLTILLIEHQMRVVMGICEYLTVMDFGEVIARGTPKEIQANQMVIEAYLGKGAAHHAGS